MFLSNRSSLTTRTRKRPCSIRISKCERGKEEDEKEEDGCDDDGESSCSMMAKLAPPPNSAASICSLASMCSFVAPIFARALGSCVRVFVCVCVSVLFVCKCNYCYFYYIIIINDYCR